MTSPPPLSIYDPICSYCWKEVESPEIFLLGKDINWVCSKKCKKGMLKDNNKKVVNNSKILLNKLIKMYVEIYKDRK